VARKACAPIFKNPWNTMDSSLGKITSPSGDRFAVGYEGGVLAFHDAT
jgi:hypothetical protein